MKETMRKSKISNNENRKKSKAKLSKASANSSYCEEKFCQSCGIPIKKSVLHPNLDYSTEKVKEEAIIVKDEVGNSEFNSISKDAEKIVVKSRRYCNLCYGDGEFYWKGESVSDFQAMVIDKMTNEGGFWWITAWILTRPIPYLERWKK